MNLRHTGEFIGVGESLSSRHARIWGLRIMLNGGGLKRFYRHGHFSDDDVSEALSIADLENRDNTGVREIRARLNEMLAKTLEETPDEYEVVVQHNLDMLASAVGLSPVEARLLHFVATAQICKWLADALRYLAVPGLGIFGLARALAPVLETPAGEVAQALQPHGVLREAGLLGPNPRGRIAGGEALQIMDGLADRLFAQAFDDTGALVQGLFDPGRESRLQPADYQHMQADYDLLRDYLQTAAAQGRAGVNILLYGAPGVGKTELVRVLCQDLAVDLFETSTGEDADDAPRGSARLQVFQLGQRMLKHRPNSAILFDEIEDVFPVDMFARMFGGRSRSETAKGNVNRLLEANPVPAFWLSNEVSQLDPAYLRRFDLAVEVRRPGRAAREKVVARYFREIPMSDACRKALIADENLTPAALASASRVLAELVAPDGPEADARVLKVLGHNQAAAGLPRPRINSEQLLPYAPDLIQVDGNLDEVLRGLGQGAGARLCLHGPPGTGKSAWARHLAEAINRPLMVKRVSDLESRWVGVCEQNIARMFAEAEDRQAVLLLDEADTFLGDRENRQHSWEVSRANEFLTRMEGFGGIFITTTNRMPALDPAVMRRFDFKLGFDYLAPAQTLEMAARCLKAWGTRPLSREQRQRLAGLRVAPGDFAVAARQGRVQGRPLDGAALVECLDREASARGPQAAGIGFLAELH